MKWRGLGSPWFNYTVQTSLWWIVLQQGGKLWFFVMPLKNLLSAVIIQHLIKSISILRIPHFEMLSFHIFHPQETFEHLFLLGPNRVGLTASKNTRGFFTLLCKSSWFDNSKVLVLRKVSVAEDRTLSVS